MRAAGLILLLAGVWSGLMWWLRTLTVEPQARVVEWSLRLGIDPNETQWLAEWLQETQAGIRLGLGIVWAAGLVLMAILAVMAVIAARTDRS